MIRWLVIFGVVLIAAGLLWPTLTGLGLDPLPGDFVIERGDFHFYVPLTTSLLASLVVSLILWLLDR
ncbi:MAG: DUF2905 domain-containing protein [Alphaproteobacteria bacterium]|jgi:hypothetical protein